LPEFRCENAGEFFVMRDFDESRLRERPGVVGEVGSAQAGEEMEGKIEAADEKSCGVSHGAWGNAEVGDEPERAMTSDFCDSVNEGIEFGLGEAVEEEVSDDEIAGILEREGKGVGLVGTQPAFRVRHCCLAAFAKELKHGGAGVDCVGLEVRILGEKSGEEATVSVAYDECAVAIEELWEVVVAAVFESPPRVRYSRKR
jgi:hypothetical protein